jgi:hypothetical protein
MMSARLPITIVTIAVHLRLYIIRQNIWRDHEVRKKVYKFY